MSTRRSEPIVPGRHEGHFPRAKEDDSAVTVAVAARAAALAGPGARGGLDTVREPGPHSGRGHCERGPAPDPVGWRALLYVSAAIEWKAEAPPGGGVSE